NKSTQASVQIANTVIQPSPDARYLGVVFDKQLRFKQCSTNRQERIQICACYFQDRKIDVGSNVPTNTNPLHHRCRSPDGLCCNNLAPPQETWPNESSTTVIKAGICTKNSDESYSGRIPDHCYFSIRS